MSLSKSRMIHVGVCGRLISSRILWKDPPPSLSVHKDIRDIVAVMKLGRRCSGRTRTPVKGGAAVAPGPCRGHSAMPLIRSGELITIAAALARFLVYEVNLQNIMVLAAANNAEPCVEIVIPSW